MSEKSIIASRFAMRATVRGIFTSMTCFRFSFIIAWSSGEDYGGYYELLTKLAAGVNINLKGKI
jgi:hypothetical protein